MLGNTIRGPDLVMDSGSDPIPDAKSADFEYCGGQIETRPVWTDLLGNLKLRFRVL